MTNPPITPRGAYHVTSGASVNDEDWTSPLVLDAIRREGGCQHRRILVDRDRTRLECRDCGLADIDPIAWISYFLKELAKATEILARVRTETADRQRTACQHCGKMTRIRNIRLRP